MAQGKDMGGTGGTLHSNTRDRVCEGDCKGDVNDSCPLAPTRAAG